MLLVTSSWLFLSACDGDVTPPDCGDPVITAPDQGNAGDVQHVALGLGAGRTEIRWSVTGGTLTDETAAETDWTLPTDVALFLPETLEVSVATAGDGCEGAVATAQVEVTWTDAARTVVIYNPSIEGSEEVASYYADFRGIDTVCSIAYPDSTTVAGADWPAWVTEAQACLDEAGPQVRYVVPVYGVPYKVSDRIQSIDTSVGVVSVSLDALLSLGAASVDVGSADWSPLYRDGDSTSGEYDEYWPIGKLLNRVDVSRWLVTRIDGADADAAMDLVDRARLADELAASGALDGIVYVDGEYGDTPPASDVFGSYESGEWNMWGTAAVFRELGWYEVVWDGNSEEFGTPPAVVTCADALYYAGWYEYNHYNDAFTWAPGAIGGHLDSCSACDLRDGTWAAEALQRGITATFGAVNEPYVSGMPEYDQFFLYLTQGANYAEAAYESTMLEAWMMVWVGDPLYRPYAGSSASAR